jgi:prevent-host-death family protein
MFRHSLSEVSRSGFTTTKGAKRVKRGKSDCCDRVTDHAMPSSIADERASRTGLRVHANAYTDLMTENTVTVREARAHLADHINRAEEGVPTVITRNGAPVAAVVPIADFEALKEAADVMLAREAEAVLAEGGPTAPMAELLADLFTEQDGEAA